LTKNLKVNQTFFTDKEMWISPVKICKNGVLPAKTWTDYQGKGWSRLLDAVNNLKLWYLCER
jgi:hypothetical protein